MPKINTLLLPEGTKPVGTTYLYDRIVEVTLKKELNPLAGEEGPALPVKDLTIGYQTGGVKPDISFSVSLLPQNKCYQCELRIVNLGLPSSQVRKFTRMEIVAGYYGVSRLQPGHKQKFSCSIFSSYVESPNPDGVTVFTGIVVGDVGGAFADHYVNIELRGKKVKLKTLVEKAMKGAFNLSTESKLDFHYYLDETLEYEYPADQSAVTSFQNGWSVVMYLQSLLFSYGKNVLGTPVFLSVWGQQVSVFALDEKVNLPVYKKYGIANLSAVTKATFTGPKLDVIAPWQPWLLPGGIFYMPPTFYQASLLPNILPMSVITSKDNLYYVIVMDIKFGTVGNNNQMHITAVPVQYVLPKDKEALTYDTDMVVMSKMADLRDTYLKKHPDVQQYVIIGEGEKVEGSIDQKLSTFWGAATDGNFQSLGGDSGVIDGMGWSEKTGRKNDGVPECLKAYKETWKLSYTKLIDRYGKDSYKKICKEKDTGISALDLTIYIPLTYFWPLVALGTYWKYKIAGNKGPFGTRVAGRGTSDVLQIDLHNPDNIKGAITCWVPAITPSMADSGQLDSFADALVAFGKYYISLYRDKPDKESQNKYIFGQQTYKAGICLGGWKDEQ